MSAAEVTSTETNKQPVPHTALEQQPQLLRTVLDLEAPRVDDGQDDGGYGRHPDHRRRSNCPRATRRNRIGPCHSTRSLSST